MNPLKKSNARLVVAGLGFIVLTLLLKHKWKQNIQGSGNVVIYGDHNAAMFGHLNQQSVSSLRKLKPVRSELKLPNETILLEPSELMQELSVKEQVIEIPQSAPNVVLRHKAFDKIFSSFSSSDNQATQVVVLVGNSAEGKTELSKKYAELCKHNYHHTWFVQVESWESYYKNLAFHWHLFEKDDIFPPKDKEGLPIDVIIKAVHEELGKKRCNNKKSLIIFDNASSDFIASKLLGQLPSNRCDILITSKDSDWHHPVINLFLPEYHLTLDEGLEILKKWIGLKRWDSFEARKIVDRFDNLPVVLAQVGSYVATYQEVSPDFSLEQFLPLFEKNKKAILEQGKLKYPSSEGYVDIYVSLIMKINQIALDYPNAIETLRYCAYLPPKDIPVSLVEKLTQMDVLKLSSSIKILDTLLTCTDGKITIHDLFQDIIMDDKPFGDDVLLKIAKTCRDNEEFEKFLLNSPKKASHIHEGAIRVLENTLYPLNWYASEKDKDLLYYSRTLGLEYRQLGDYLRAVDALKKALNTNNKISTKKTREQARLYSDIGGIYGHLGDAPQSLEFTKKALEIDEALNFEDGKVHPNTIKSHRVVAWSYDISINHLLAFKHRLKAHNITVKVVENENSDIARTYQDLGWSLQRVAKAGKSLDDMREQVEDFDQQLQELEKHLNFSNSEQKRDIQRAYQEMGLSLEKVSNIKNPLSNLALRCQQKALIIDRKHLGDHHPDTAKSYSKLGWVLGDCGLHSAAIKCHYQALEIGKETMGKDHPLMADCYSNIAWNLKKLGKNKEALQMQLEALQIRQEKLGKKHRNTIQTERDIEKLRQK